MPKKQHYLSKWDKRYITIAKLVSSWSKDPSKVGAVLVTNEGIALGYNGFPIGIEDDERLSDRATKLKMIIHAEQNALLIAGSRARGSSIYVWGKPICARCAVLIIQAGVDKIVATNPEDELDKTSEWYESGKLAVEMFKESGRNLVFYKAKSFFRTLQ